MDGHLFVDPNSLIREHLERIVTIKGDLCKALGGAEDAGDQGRAGDASRRG